RVLPPHRSHPHAALRAMSHSFQRRSSARRIPSDFDTSQPPLRLRSGTPSSRRVPIRQCPQRLTPPYLRISQSWSFLFLDQLLDRTVSAWVGPASRRSSSY